ncbi:MAG TPA: hypothetical protein VFG71_12665, partial [Nitrospiraceae bacterium]|nr:hypothetical protein [Nitrospiraceae bacterium]
IDDKQVQWVRQIFSWYAEGVDKFDRVVMLLARAQERCEAIVNRRTHVRSAISIRCASRFVS